MIKHLTLLKIQNMIEYQLQLASMVQKFFDKKSALIADKPAPGDSVKFEIMPNQELAG